mmetsp:Transcript_69315/g.184871  ORF Transcript_69315/g.184871 Transcript_69315/m.184871 type:complete len:352 (-) Transcript_69315:105-1160(-)
MVVQEDFDIITEGGALCGHDGLLTSAEFEALMRNQLKLYVQRHMSETIETIGPRDPCQSGTVLFVLKLLMVSISDLQAALQQLPFRQAKGELLFPRPSTVDSSFERMNGMMTMTTKGALSSKVRDSRSPRGISIQASPNRAHCASPSGTFPNASLEEHASCSVNGSASPATGCFNGHREGTDDLTSDASTAREVSCPCNGKLNGHANDDSGREVETNEPDFARTFATGWHEAGSNQLLQDECEEELNIARREVHDLQAAFADGVAGLDEDGVRLFLERLRSVLPTRASSVSSSPTRDDVDSASGRSLWGDDGDAMAAAAAAGTAEYLGGVLRRLVEAQPRLAPVLGAFVDP